MNTDDVIKRLEEHWDCDGFLYAVRGGQFDPIAANEFLAYLQTIRLGDEQHIPKRLVTLLWYLPIFLEWQRGRVAEGSAPHALAYDRFSCAVQGVLEDVLGVP